LALLIVGRTPRGFLAAFERPISTLPLSPRPNVARLNAPRAGLLSRVERVSAGRCVRVLLDHGPGIIGEMLRQIVQGSSRSEFLSDLGSRRVGRVSPRATMTRQRPIASIEMDNHVAVVLILSCLEHELPGMWL